jgi:hypothetical protein
MATIFALDFLIISPWMNEKKIPQPKCVIVHVIQAVTGKTREN